ncbi:hypothetical protein C0416_03950 [bacterium]|nr:hypothetical protein [bacterium]
MPTGPVPLIIVIGTNSPRIHRLSALAADMRITFASDFPHMIFIDAFTVILPAFTTLFEPLWDRWIFLSSSVENQRPVA